MADTDTDAYPTPVIASSNRYADLAPYCARIYSAEYHKYRAILPWDFPHHPNSNPSAARATEEAFLRTFFTDAEIHVQGFRFLKQAWYCIALWNANAKVPRVAEQWAQEFGEAMLGDGEMRGFVVREDAAVGTFFGPGEVEVYGERVLGVAVRHIQWLVGERARREAEGGKRVDSVDGGGGGAAQEAGKARSSSGANCVSGTNGNNGVNGLKSEPVSLPDVIKSVQVQKVGLAGSHQPYSASPSSQRAPEPVKRSRAESDVDRNSHVPPPQSRKRGISNTKPYNNRNATTLRYDPQRSNLILSSPYQPSPNYNMAVPTVGNDRSFSGTIQPRPRHNQMRMPSDDTPNYAQSPSAHPQQFQGPPPPGMFGPGIPQQVGSHMHPFEQQIQQLPPGFGPPQYQQPQPSYCDGNQLHDRSNDRLDDRAFGSDTPFGDDVYRDKRGPKRRDSNASRGGGRPRGFSNGGGRGKSGRGRNSFTGSRPQNDYNDPPSWVRGPSIDQSLAAGSEFGHKYQHHRNSAASGNWRANTERSQYQQNENIQPGRAFSGPDHYGPPAPTFGVPPSENAGFPSKPVERRNFQPEFRRSSHGHQPQAQQHPFKPRQTEQNMPQPAPAMLPRDPDHPYGIVHDLNDPFAKAHPGRLVTELNIGMACSHVTKLLIFSVPANIDCQLVGESFEHCGPVAAVNDGVLKIKYDSGRPVRDVWITFADHLSARQALEMDAKPWIGGTLKIRVPREYFERCHERYPGQGHPQQPPRSMGRHHVEPLVPEKQVLQGRAAVHGQLGRESEAERRGSGGSTPTARAPADPMAHEELLSGSTTPTPSGASTPGKKGKNKKKGKEVQGSQEDEVEGLVKEAETPNRASDAAEGKQGGATSAAVLAEASTTTTTTVHPEDPTEDPDAISAQESLMVETTADARGSVSSQTSEQAQTKSEPAFSPDTDFKARLPQLPEPAARETESLPEALQPFRGPTETEEEAGNSGPATAADSADEEAAAAESAHEGSGQAESEVGQFTDGATVNDETFPAKSSHEGEEDPIDDSFHTADGTPQRLKRADGMLDRGSEESTGTEDSAVTARTNTTDSSGAETVTAQTVGERAEESRALESSEIAEQTEENAAAEAIKTAGEDQTIAGTQAENQPPAADGPPSPASTASASAVRAASKKAPVALPKVKIVEPSKSQDGDGAKAHDPQRSTSGTSVPPTPAFVTAPTTPAVSDEAEKSKSDIAPVPQEDQPPQKKAEKTEKPKGPAQTASVMGSLFAKPQKQKPKKVKAQKGKGSIKGKPKGDDDAASEAPSEDLDRVVSGTVQLGATAGERVTACGGVIDNCADVTVEKKRNDSKVPMPADESAKTDVSSSQPVTERGTASQSPRDGSPAKPRSTFSNILSSFSFGSSKPSPAATPGVAAVEPSAQSKPADDKSAAAASKAPHLGKSADVPQDANWNKMFSGGHDLPPPKAQMANAGSDPAVHGHSQQPFRSFREDDLTAGTRDSGHSGGGPTSEVGLGITASADAAVDSAVNDEAKPKKRKKKSSKKKRTKEQMQAQEGGGEADEVLEETEGTPPAGQHEETKEDVFHFRFKANSEPAAGTPNDAASEDTSQTLISEAGSEASSRTLGRIDSREHTPSSTGATASAQHSPARPQNRVKKQGDGVIVPAPNRNVLRRQKGRVASASKTPESEVSSERELERESGIQTLYIEDPVSDEDEGGREMDKVLEQASRQPMRRKPPMLYLYVGPGSHEEEAVGNKGKARVEEVEEVDEGGDGGGDDEEVEEAAKRRVEKDATGRGGLLGGTRA